MHSHNTGKTNRITPDEAELISIKALGFLAQDAERLAQFLDLTGLDVENLRAQAQKRHFLSEILNYLLTNESLLLVFCSNAGVDPAILLPAQRALMEAGETD